MREAILITALLAALVSCAKHVPKFTYDTNINSVVIVKNQLGGHGTGFYIGDNLIVTAKHVVPENVGRMSFTENGYEFVVKDLVFTAIDYDKNSYKLEVVYNSDVNDISILKIEDGHNLTPVVFGKEPRIGDRLYMISHPAHLMWSYSEGYVVNIPAKFDEDEFAMLHDIARFYGSSGAGIFNESGEVVGIMNALLKDSSLAIGHTVRRIKEDIAKYRANE